MKKHLLLFFSILIGQVHGQIITTIAGDSTAGFSGDGGPAVSAELYNPMGMAVDTIGNVYIADYNNNRVRKINLLGTIITIAGGGPASTGYSGDGGPADSATMVLPWGIALDKKGDLYIVDSGNGSVRKVDSAGIISTVIGYGQYGFSGDGGPATSAQLYQPYGVFVDDTGNIFVTDTWNFRVRKVNAQGIITTIAGDGIAGYTGDGGPAISARLNIPAGIVGDHNGNLYIADLSNYCVRKIDPSGIITTVVGTGISGYSGDGGLASQAQIRGPNNLAFDKKGNLYISEHGYRIRMVDTAGIISTVVGNGIQGFSGDGGFATQAEIDRPSGIAFDRTGNMYFADIMNNRVRKVTMTTDTRLVYKDKSVLVYPNPFTSVLKLQLPDQMNSIVVRNTLGEIVFTVQTRLKQLEVDLSGQPSGVYFVQINTSGAKLIKQ